MVAVRRPRCAKACASNCTVEVLPLVPVTPTSSIDADGSPWKREAILAEMPAQMLDPDNGSGEPRIGDHRRFGQHRDRTPLDRRRREFDPVLPRTRKRDEGIARAHAA